LGKWFRRSIIIKHIWLSGQSREESFIEFNVTCEIIFVWKRKLTLFQFFFIRFCYFLWKNEN